MTPAIGSILIDLEGPELTQTEQELLKHPVCAGVVLFTRNYQNIQQLRKLTAQIYQAKSNAFIAVDQEGGRVQRFRDHFTVLPAMSHWGQLYDQNPQDCVWQLSKAIHTLCNELRYSGVNLNLIPVLDLDYQISSVIGARSLHSDPNVVSFLGRMIINEMHHQKFPAVGKHFPGHGAVTPDSHLTLPIDHRNWSEIWQNDLRPFVNLIHQLDAIMPAHIVFSAMDHLPASFSPFWLQEVLRKQLNFKGIIISDDLTMAAAATRGSYAERAVEAFLAGCDLLLVCNNRPGAIVALNALQSCNREASERRLAEFYNKSMLL